MRATVLGLFAVAAAVGATAPAWAQQDAAVKIGFVNVEKAVFTIDEGKARLEELQAWAKPREEDLARLNTEISSLQGEIAAKRTAATEQAVADLNRRLVARQREFEDKQRVGKREFDERQNRILQDVGTKLNEVITRYADSNRFTAVFIRKPNDLIYLATSADLTDTVVKLYNERYPYTKGK